MIFNTKLNGIPCQCNVLNYVAPVSMCITGPAFSDATPPEGEEFDFEILDRHGYKAKWLDRYVSDVDRENLLEQFLIMSKAEQYETEMDYEYGV